MSGALDINDNALILHNSTGLFPEDLGANEFTEGYLAQGYDGGWWDGSADSMDNGQVYGGIISSIFGAPIDVYTHTYSVGVVSNAGPNDNALHDFWRGQHVTASDTLIAFTYAGDANLDGVVDGDDYLAFDNGLLSQNSDTPLIGWQNGDFQL